MCGIAGILATNGTVRDEQLQSMLRCLNHRGPDDSGWIVNSTRNVGLAHGRLSILDLSPAGHQPMSTNDGRYTIVFNGEVYNFRELRPDLERDGVRFRSDSDTEVLLYLYAKYGPAMLQKLAGMFAFAIWDETEKCCFFARDPLGIKPLYYGANDGRLLFASEIRAIFNAWQGPKRIDSQSLGEYLLFGSVPDPGTLVEGIHSLPAGHTMTWKHGSLTIDRYWTPTYHPRAMSDADAIRVTREALDDSIERHLVSDVPVGIFLSGGIDSTALLGLATARGIRDINTFCISFDEAAFNEGSLADRTAKHFQTQHHDWRLTAEDGQQLIDEFLNSLDRPTNDGFNTYCVSLLARRHGLKVVLSGLGGDELFGSYPSFQLHPKLTTWRKIAQPLGPVRQALAAMMEQSTSKPNLQRLAVLMQLPASELAAYWTIRGFFTPGETRALVKHYTNAGDRDFTPALTQAIPAQSDAKDTVAYLESTRYMQYQLLRDSDVFSMAHALELRVPFVDSRLFDAVNQIPASIRLAPGKRLLCNAVPEIPEWIVNSPKKGFRFPFEDWVSRQWQGRFADLERSVPVRLKSWYRKWTLFTLEHYLTVHGIG